MGKIIVSLTDASEQKLRDYHNALPEPRVKLSYIVENAILDYLAKEKKA